MFSFSMFRKRAATEQVTPGESRILGGAFGVGNPFPGQSSSPLQVGKGFPGGPYSMHEGDIFEPGTGNWVLDPFQETPLNTTWGHAFLVNDQARAGFFKAITEPQVYINQSVKPEGLGGLVAGQFVGQPLSPPEA